MTELYIAGVQVVLPQGFKVQIVEENPLLTDNGEYSFDISLSMLDKTNAMLYSNKNRWNNSTGSITGRQATLIVNGEVKLRGQEIILGFEAPYMKIQIVSGNSELNYSFSSRRKIWDHDFGTVDNPVPYTRNSVDVYTQKYPDNDYVVPSYCLEPGFTENVDPGAIWRNKWCYDFIPPSTGLEFRLENASACPFLVFLAEKFMELKGYTVKRNVLRDNDYFCHLYMLNPTDSNEIAKMLPDWTELEFIKELEKFFNVAFVVDKLDNSVSILNFNRANMPLQQLNRVIDQYSYDVIQPGSGNTAYKDYSNPAYDLPGSTWLKHQDIPDGVLLKKMLPVPFSTFDGLLTAYTSVTQRQDLYDGNNEENLVPKQVEQISNPYPFSCRINRFLYTDLGSGDTHYMYPFTKFDSLRRPLISRDATLTMRIVPAEMQFITFPLITGWYQGTGRVPGRGHIPYQMPCVSEPVYYADTQGMSLDMILDGNDTDLHPANLQVAYFSSYRLPFKIRYLAPANFDMYFYLPIPYSFVNGSEDIRGAYQYYRDFYTNTYGGLQTTDADAYFNAMCSANEASRLDIATLITQQNSDLIIDFSQPYTIMFAAQQVNPGSVFVINNKQFVCERIEYEADANGIVGNIMKGIFYPLQ